MKKIISFISVFLMLGAAVFADVSVKKLDGGKAEVTFFYGNPRASEVVIAGTFTDWQNGALPMTKIEGKGWEYKGTFAATDEIKYKFISDGNWTTDLKAPGFVDDGFGGKNGYVNVGDMLAAAGGGDGAAKKSSIKFISWTMLGMQGNFKTQGVNDKTKKGLDFDSAALGFKSYDKFTGEFLPNCPFYIELALSETDLEDYKGDGASNHTPIYLYQKDAYNQEIVSWNDGLKDFFSGIFAHPVSYLAKTTNNKASSNAGPGTNPFLGHLKFGFDTPYISYYTGFNYAKPNVRQNITWKTIDGNWDAGYEHVGGFNVFSNGAALQQIGDVKLDVGFAPNKSADRRGTKYGYWGWVDAKYNDFVVDFQTNGMYNGDYLFDDPVEHDFILGAKDKIGGLSFAAQGLVATHQMSSDDILKGDVASKASDSVGQYFGHSTDVFYRTSDFDGIQNIAANARVGFEGEDKNYGVNVEYRMRGAQASMLYMRENHDDGTFDLSNELGVLNSQRIGFDGYVKPMEALSINLGATAEMALEKLDSTDTLVKGWTSNIAAWYVSRHLSEMTPLFGVDSGMELTFQPAVSYALTDTMSVGVYADLNYKNYSVDDAFGKTYVCEKYASSDSAFRMKKAGATFAAKNVSDTVKGVNVFYGLDDSNSVRMFNTVVGSVSFPSDVTANVAVGLKTVKSTDAADSYNKDENNPFAFALGVSKKFVAFKKPTVYAQFVYNMDPFKHFGDGQDQLNIDRANVNGSYASEGVGPIDAVDWYDGRAAVRVGIRWDI